MASVDLKKVRLALRTNLLILNTDLPEYRAWENRAFTPPDNDFWIEEKQTLVSEVQIASNTIEVIGFYVIRILTTKGKGTGEIESIQKLIADQFPSATSYLSPDGTTSVEVFRTERDDPKEFDETTYAGLVRMYWRAYGSVNI